MLLEPPHELELEHLPEPALPPIPAFAPAPELVLGPALGPEPGLVPPELVLGHGLESERHSVRPTRPDS